MLYIDNGVNKCQLAMCDSISSVSIVLLFFAFQNNDVFKHEIVCFPYHEDTTIMFCSRGMCVMSLKRMINAAGFNNINKYGIIIMIMVKINNNNENIFY